MTPNATPESTEIPVDEVEKNVTVSGGKVWNPARTVTATASSRRLPFALMSALMTAFIASIAGLCVFAASRLPTENVPENISMQTFSWFRWYELALLVIVLICMAYIASQVPVGMMPFTAVVILVLAMGPTLALFTKDNMGEINAWAKQYGYSFSLYAIPDMFLYPHQAKATNLQTGEEETLTLIEMNGNLVWEGMEKVTTETTDDIPTVDVAIGEENIVDSATGIEYKVDSKNGELVLVPVE